MNNFIDWLNKPSTPDIYIGLFVIGVMLFAISFIFVTLIVFGFLGIPLIAAALLIIPLMAYRGRNK